MSQHWNEERTLKEYALKEGLLESLCEEVSPFTFYEDMFFDFELPVPLRYINKDYRIGVEKCSLMEAVEKAQGIPEVILSPCTYKNNYPKKALIQYIYAFVVDVDNCAFEVLQDLLLNGWRNAQGEKMLEPSYIVNSGAGVHFYFCMTDALFYPNKRRELDELNRRLTLSESNLPGIEVDMRPIGQGFRLPGSLNKLGKTIRVYKYKNAGKWSVEHLAQAVNMFDFKTETSNDIARRQLMELSQISFEKETKPLIRWNISRKWYDVELEHCREKVYEHNRYTSCLALSIIAYKCGVSKEELKRDLFELYEVYARRPSGTKNKFKLDEVVKAMNFYNERALTARSETLEKMLGYGFTHMNRHYGDEKFPRKKTDEMRAEGHLTNLEARAWEERDKKYPDGTWRKNAGRKSKKDIVLAFQAAHPDAKISEAATELKLNRKTVAKWWNKT